MKRTTRTITGPSTKRVSQVDALHKLEQTIAREGVKGTVVERIDDVDGRWVAKVSEPVVAHRQAGPPPFADDAPPSEDGPDGPPSGPPEPSDDAGSDDEGPPKDKKKDEKGKEPNIAEVLDLVKAIAAAVGVPVPGDVGPGGDEPPLADEPGPPQDGPVEAPDGPPAPKKGPVGPGRPLKPGEVPNRPGAVPGLPTFGSERENPFPEFIGKTASFEVRDDENPTRSIVQARDELNQAVVPFGYAVDQVTPKREGNTKREIVALITHRGSVDEAAKAARLDPDTFEPLSKA